MARTQRKTKVVTVAPVDVVEAAVASAEVWRIREAVAEVMPSVPGPGAAAEIVSVMNAVEITANGAELFITLDKLKKSPRNARKTPHSEAHIEALAASIAAKGMLQNLVVEPEVDEVGQPTGFYFVTVGEGRRLAHLLRAKRQQIDKTEQVRCVLDTANDPQEISLDENVTREAMHPADQFEAFRALAEHRGWGAEEIAARFGVTAHVVKQRMRLGAVSPKLMQVYRDGELTLDQLMAFAVTDDHARQEQVYAGLGYISPSSSTTRASPLRSMPAWSRRKARNCPSSGRAAARPTDKGNGRAPRKRGFAMLRPAALRICGELRSHCRDRLHGCSAARCGEPRETFPLAPRKRRLRMAGPPVRRTAWIPICDSPFRSA